MKKIVLFTLLFSLAFCSLSIASNALFGDGVTVIADEVEIVKTGLFGQKLTFSDKDFKSAFCISDFNSITVTKLPSSNEGTLLLAGRRIKKGQTIKRKNIAAMVFVPASGEVSEADFSFTISDVGGGNEFIFNLKFIDKINYAPKLPTDAQTSLTLTTQSDISVYGRMLAEDPENDDVEYILVSYPTDGSIKIIDGATGAYKYTPNAGFTGQDRFVYVARDCYGNYSEPVSVNLRTIERMSEAVYRDMTEREEYNAAVAMSAMGIMSGKLVGDDSYFQPDVAVTKAEFVSMAMKAMGIRSDSSISKSFFDDNDDIPTSLVGYVATAQRLGIVDGSFTESGLVFEPNKTITKYEAATVMARILGLGTGEESEYIDVTDVPVWARGAVLSMQTLGIFRTDDKVADTSLITRANAAEYIYRMISVS